MFNFFVFVQQFIIIYRGIKAIVIYKSIIVVKYFKHKKYRSEIGIQTKTEAYIQSLVLKKTLESISFERRRGLEEEDGHNEVDILVNKFTEISTEEKVENTQ